MGPALARPGPLRRDQQLRARRPQAARLALPRLRHPLASTTTSRTTASSASNSPATSCPTATPTRLIATGFYRLGIWDDEPADREQARYDGLDDIVATTGQVFLGLTVDCARCHDHKFDPIPQKDYYRLLAFFHNINHYRNGGPTDEVPIFADRRSRTAYERRSRELEAAAQRGPGRRSPAIEKEFRGAYEHGARRPSAQPTSTTCTTASTATPGTKLPDFDALKPEDAGKLPARPLRPRRRAPATRRSASSSRAR